MAEVLSGGGERPPRRWPRVAAAVVAAALVAGVGLGQLLRGGPPAARPAAPPTALPSASTPGEVRVEPRLAGVPAAMPSGVRLVVGGPRPVGLGVGAPNLRRVPVPAGWAVDEVTSMAAGLLVAVQSEQPSYIAARSKIYLLRPDGRAVLLAAANQAVPRFDGREIFTVRDAPSVPNPGNPPRVLSEVSLSGRVLDKHPVAPWFNLQSDTPAGLLVGMYRPPDGPADLQIVDRRTLTVRHRLGAVSWPLATTPTRAAWVIADCTMACQLITADLVTGARHTLTLTTGYQPATAAFSPDGRHLAISYFGPDRGSPGGPAPGVVDVVDLATGHRQRLPGVAVGNQQPAEVSWTPDGRWLAVAVGWPRFRRIGLWPATGGPVHLLPGHYAGGYLSRALLAV